MFIQVIPNSTDLVTLTYDSKLYVALATTPGETFTKNRADVTSGISEISTQTLSNSINQVGEQTDCIIDDLFNVYFVATTFQININYIL